MLFILISVGVSFFSCFDRSFYDFPGNFLAGDLQPAVLVMLGSKGHEKFVKMPSDPVRVEMMEEVNEDVTGYGDDARNPWGGASFY